MATSISFRLCPAAISCAEPVAHVTGASDGPPNLPMSGRVQADGGGREMVSKRRAERGRPRRDRRRTARRAAGWESRYVLADCADELWFLAASDEAACVVRDLSMAGARLELEDRDLSVGDRMVL